MMQDTNPLINLLKSYGHLSEKAEAEISDKIKSIAKKKGSYIVKEGQIAPSLFVVETGLIRSFYKKGEQEITIWFGSENILFASATSFFNNKPSHETIQCLEDSVFLYISVKDLNDLYLKFPEINNISWKLTEEYCKLLDDRIFAFQTQSAEERYKALIKNEPEVIKRVPLGYIASYLGITQETLSRIRKK